MTSCVHLQRALIISLFFIGMMEDIHGQNNPFPWPENRSAAISLSFDDARQSNVDVGLNLFREFDVQVTYYVNPAQMLPKLDLWKMAVQEGHEIGNHSAVHPCTGNFDWSRSRALESYSIPSMRKELVEANAQIEELLGVSPVSYAYTCGNTFVGRGLKTSSYVPLIAELFESGRGWLNEAPNDPHFVDLAQLQGIEMDGKDFETDIKPLLEKARELGSWVVLAGHEIGAPDFQTTEVTMLRELFEYLAKQEDYWLAPVGDVAARIQQHRKQSMTEMNDHLSFYASFDHGLSADFARGDKVIYSAPSQEASSEKQGGVLPPHVELNTNAGLFGNALQFSQKTKEVVFYRAQENIPYSNEAFEGTISVWLSLDPEQDLEPGYCDPIQFTDAGYNDAAYWVDFTKENPRQFRMGIFGDLSEWNPNNIGPDDNPKFAERLVVAKQRPFGHDIWTHVVISFKNINGQEGGRAAFYVNGLFQGDCHIPESFGWNIVQANLYLGLNYIGKMDELAIFDKALNANEVQLLFQLDEGVREILE